MPRGVLTGSTRPHQRRKLSAFCPPRQRVYPTLTDCRHLDHLLIVGHQGVLSLLTALLLQMPAAAMWHFPIAHGAWSLLEIRDFTTLRVLNSQAVWQSEEEFPPTIDRPEQAVILRCQAASAKAALQKLFYKNGDAISARDGMIPAFERPPTDICPDFFISSGILSGSL
jgi:hypothetical protein